MKLSIIIPVYNVEKYISECLDSLMNQDLNYQDHEIIIVNDGSTDGSLKIAQSYAETNGHIKIIEKKNGGAGSARNVGMNCAKGKYIYFVDPDDYLIENCLNKLVDTCERHNLNILTFLSTTFSTLTPKKESTSQKTNFNVSFDEDMLSSIVSGEDYLAYLEYRNEVWWYLINREFLESLEIKFVEGRYLEDAAFTLELFLAANRMAHLKLDAHRHRICPGTAMSSKEPVHYLKILRDIQNAALAFNPMIKSLENKKTNPECIARLKAKQQSFVFFSMIRMLKSTISFAEVKQRMNEMIHINAFPLDSFLGEDYNKMSYHILVKLLNGKRRFYFIFLLINPFFKLRYKFSNPE